MPEPESLSEEFERLVREGEFGPVATFGVVHRRAIAAALRGMEAIDHGFSELDGLSGKRRPQNYCGKGQVEVRPALDAYRSALREEGR